MAPSQKTLGKGSPAPGPVPKDHIRLYSMRFCPFAQRTRLVLIAKGIKHEIINVHLKEKPDWFLAKNPLGLVPTLETPSGQVIYESPITCEYLDEVYPEKKLLPSDPFERAQQKMLLEHYSKVTPYFYKIPVGKAKGEDVSALEKELEEKFAQFNEILVNKKTKFFGGDSVTMIDYLMWPCLDRTPQLKRWTEHMLEDPAVQATMFSTDTHKVFYKSFMEGNPDYDYVNTLNTIMAPSPKCQGKACPAPGPVPKGLIRLYSMRFCPFAQRARLNPAGTVPVLETSSGQVIYESPITCEYLEDAYPEKKLCPSDPFERAQQRMLLEHYSKVIPCFYSICMGKNKGQDVSAAEAEFTEKVSKLNETLAKNKTKYFGGDSITMIDYLIWPWFERAEIMGVKHCLANTPELRKWIERMYEDPAVKATMFSSEDHKVFFDSFMAGNPNYDHGL
ncbi:Glutathione S-transferase omega-1 [Labeo rohita]|uniref:Glutathione-dependent dehydroascorbate reductase n=1 Tax=Labeo rohita TaxID=84645 RepID=A0ABQ8M4L1_LABRO|nr:Glutathione S-transferase omega-1 [Labeo rohita]